MSLFLRFLGNRAMSSSPELQVVLLKPNSIAPTRQSPGAAGYDLHAAEEVTIAPGERALVKTGLQIAVPVGTYGRIAPRSSLALRNAIDVGAGVIDSDYRGEVGVLLFNLSRDPEASFTVHVGDRIAQLILEKIETPPVRVVTSLTATERGAGGFGSTGL
jgi:dUTP pyrophosphatase